MLVVDDNKRFSALEVFNHSWIKVLHLIITPLHLWKFHLLCLVVLCFPVLFFFTQSHEFSGRGRLEKQLEILLEIKSKPEK